MKNVHGNHRRVVDLADGLFEYGRQRGVFDIVGRVSTEDRLTRPDGSPFVNMCSCSYLGLHEHPAILRGAIEAIEREGTIDLALARVRIRPPILDELEAALSRLFGAHAISTISATAAVTGILPMLASGALTNGSPPTMIFDRFAHFCMALMKPACADETEVLTCPNNDLDFIEDVCKRGGPVAYVADGFYSMGGGAKVQELLRLQERYGLFLFFDDSHALSVVGERGEGFVRPLLGPEMNPRTIIVASLCKGFGTAGGVVMLARKQDADIIERFAGPMAWSQGLSVPGIGAALASAKLHETEELPRLQRKLKDNIDFFERHWKTPMREQSYQIKRVMIGDERSAIDASRRMLDGGFYTSAVFFPIVGRGKAGLRIMLRAGNREEDLLGLCTLLEEVRGRAVEDGSLDD
jgi:7-keto-8-aminopelargonate synthetase-like enzyme